MDDLNGDAYGWESSIYSLEGDMMIINDTTTGELHSFRTSAHYMVRASQQENGRGRQAELLTVLPALPFPDEPVILLPIDERVLTDKQTNNNDTNVKRFILAVTLHRMHIFDTFTSTWSTISSSPLSNGANGCPIVIDSMHLFVYVSGQGELSTEMNTFNLRTRQWGTWSFRPLPTKMIAPYHAYVINDHLYLGALEVHERPLKDKGKYAGARLLMRWFSVPLLVSSSISDSTSLLELRHTTISWTPLSDLPEIRRDAHTFACSW
jgi:hypothetical protein